MAIRAATMSRSLSVDVSPSSSAGGGGWVVDVVVEASTRSPSATDVDGPDDVVLAMVVDDTWATAAGTELTGTLVTTGRWVVVTTVDGAVTTGGLVVTTTVVGAAVV